jgi:hypothetical protein
MTSQRWLGSDFCARHILRNLKDVPVPPAFWIREQTGGEACPWLLFEHKHAYLRATPRPLGRRLAVPDVLRSPQCGRQFRALRAHPLLLAVALMEALGIHVKVCDDRAYSDVEASSSPGRTRPSSRTGSAAKGYGTSTPRGARLCSATFARHPGTPALTPSSRRTPQRAGLRALAGISTWTGRESRTGAGASNG